MKSAYELAMERLAKTEPAAVPLTDEQKSRLAEIEKRYSGKIAEAEILGKQRLNAAMAAENADEIEKIKKQISAERIRMEEDRESEKERARRSFEK